MLAVVGGARSRRTRPGRPGCTVIRSILAGSAVLDFVDPGQCARAGVRGICSLTMDIPQLAWVRWTSATRRGWIGRVDFVERRARVVVETDGKEHHSSLHGSPRGIRAGFDAFLRRGLDWSCGSGGSTSSHDPEAGRSRRCDVHLVIVDARLV